jgi:hypothetical protein
LSLHNPEEEFHKSDYYLFIQRIFRDDKLDELRPDITILTYNYDCYLDFLILEAFRYRQKLSESPLKIDDLCANKLTSGFFNPTDGRDWASQTQGFNYFKLHGSIAYGNEPYFGHNELFQSNMTDRLRYVGEGGIQFEVPPVVFPWELFDGDSGHFISEDEFIFVKQNSAPATNESARLLFRHFKSIWENAKRAVLKADKISFVGLSMHEYLKDGLTYLFDGFNKAPMPEFQRAIDAGIMKDQPPKQVQVVVANPENEQFKNAENRLHPSSLCGKVADLLKDVAPKMHYVRSSSEYDGIFRSTDTPDKKEDPDITPRYNFEEFIQREMG